jgi:translation initiation factor IF-3
MSNKEKEDMSQQEETVVSRGSGPSQQRGSAGRTAGSEAQINEKISARALQLIAEDGKNLGLIGRDEALKMARSAGLDLVIIAEKDGEAPIAKIMDYGKSLYAKKKQQTSSRKKQKVIQVKEIQISHKIGQHDLETKANKARDFLAEGKHVKIVVTFYGRINLAEYTPMRDQRGSELFTFIDQTLGIGTSKVVHEKDTRTRTLWSRVYFSK